MPEKVERCSTPEFDEQYAPYRAQYMQAPPEAPFQHMTQGPQSPHGQQGNSDDYISQPTPILYPSFIPVHVAVPAQSTEVMSEWPAYTQQTYVPDWGNQYQAEVRPYAPQQYVMVQMQPQAQSQQPQSHWGTSHRNRIENVGLDRSRADSHA